MKYLMVVLVLVMCVVMTGCLTSEQQARLNVKLAKLDLVMEDIEKYKSMKDEVMDRFKTGELTAEEVKVLFSALETDIGEAKDTAVGIKDEIADLRREGASGFDIVTGIITGIISIIGSLTGVRLWRGGVNNRNGDIGVT